MRKTASSPTSRDTTMPHERRTVPPGGYRTEVEESSYHPGCQRDLQVKKLIDTLPKCQSVGLFSEVLCPSNAFRTINHLPVKCAESTKQPVKSLTVTMWTKVH